PFHTQRELPVHRVAHVRLRLEPVEPDAEAGQRTDAPSAHRPEPDATAHAEVLADLGRIRVDPRVEGYPRTRPDIGVQRELDAAAPVGGSAASAAVTRRTDRAPAEGHAQRLIRLDLLRGERKREGEGEERLGEQQGERTHGVPPEAAGPPGGRAPGANRLRHTPPSEACQARELTSGQPPSPVRGPAGAEPPGPDRERRPG